MSAKVCVWRYLKAQREFLVQHLDSASYSTHRKVFHFASVHCKWALGHRRPQHFWIVFLFSIDRTLNCICEWHAKLCSPTMISGSVSEPMQGFLWQNHGCFLMQCCLRARRSQVSSNDYQPCAQRFLQIPGNLWWYYVLLMMRYSKFSQYYMEEHSSEISSTILQINFFPFWQIKEPLFTFTSTKVCPSIRLFITSLTDLFPTNLLICKILHHTFLLSTTFPILLLPRPQKHFVPNILHFLNFLFSAVNTDLIALQVIDVCYFRQPPTFEIRIMIEI